MWAGRVRVVAARLNRAQLTSPRRSMVWRVLVPIVCLIAGVVFAASAHDSRGTEIRAPQTTDLADLVRTAEAQVQAADRELVGVQAHVNAAAAQAGSGNSEVAAAQAKVTPLQAPAGLTAVTGPGIVVALDDARDTSQDAGVDPNILVVHQSDLQAVVNALWAGGAEAMTISGQRVIATSAVRCVGNTLLLNGEVFSPPFRVAALGSYRTMRERLDSSPGVTLFTQAADYYGLGYTVEQQDHLELPAYSGPIGLTYAKAVTR
jgi:uncharacterized protein YlxW (UPF0749 family)